MIRRLVGCLASGLAVIFVFFIFGCSGGNSGEDAFGDPLPETQWVAQTYDEKCALCHRPGSVAGVAAVHARNAQGIEGQITSATVNAGTGLVTVDFSLFDSENHLIPIGDTAAGDIRFTLAKLVPGTGGDADRWASYINQTEIIASDTPGNLPDGTPVTVGDSRVQATYEKASDADGVFTNNGDGTYSYQFSFDIRAVIDPVTVVYDETLTHRVAMQVSGNTANAYLDFVPDGSPVTDTRDIVADASCNKCHLKLEFHGGERIQTAYCVTCHNPGSADANSGNTVDFTAMVHKIHMGASLPSVVELWWEYAVWGHYDTKYDYSQVVLPRDVRFPGLGGADTTCGTCHSTGDADDSDNWHAVPTMAACTSCHDITSFDATPPEGYDAHSGGPQADNGSCAVCHPATGSPPAEGISVVDAHTMPDQVAARAFEYNILEVTDSQGGPVDPGDFVTVTFSVTDPANADGAYDILNDAPFAGGSLSVLVGWDAKDIHNTGSGEEMAQPVSMAALESAADNMDGSFSVTSDIAIPEGVEGNGIAALQGRLAGDFDGDGDYTDRVAPTNASMSFPVGSAEDEGRRVVVDLDKCNACHGRLSLHGGNRTDELQVCALCHNANATDLEVRPEDSTDAVDGKIEEAIDFKYMIHAIHAGAADVHGFRQTGIVVYGYRGSINDFSHVALPTGLENLKNCIGCHEDDEEDTFTVPLDENVLPTTVLTEADLEDPDDDVNITPATAVCSSCHDDIEAKTHMSEYGGLFDFVAFVEETVPEASDGSSQEDLCGPGPASQRPGGHTSRLDCCSCHNAN